MSSRFGHRERMIASALGRFPFLKKLAKNAYQRLNFLLFRKPYRFHTGFEIQEIRHDNKETFFGYYDHSPLNKTSDYLIFQASSRATTKRPDPRDPLEVVLYDWKKKEVKAVFHSIAYNWQQGTKLQWLDEKRFIFNDYDAKRDRYVSRIVDAEKGEVTRTSSHAIYDCHHNFGIGLNFDRLTLLRPDYGYFNRREYLSLSKLNDKKDGIFYIDLEHDQADLLISIREIKNFKSRKSFTTAQHKVNHIMLSPAGDKFIFLHRWIAKGLKTDRLILYHMKTKDLFLLAEGMVSHFAWVNNDELFGYMAPEGEEAAYYQVDLKSMHHRKVDDQLNGNTGDGHPNVHGQKILFDTYPNKSRMKELFVYDMKDKELQKIGEFFEGLAYSGESRCDLHPRWDFHGKIIFVDSVHSGKRKLYAILYAERSS